MYWQEMFNSTHSTVSGWGVVNSLLVEEFVVFNFSFVRVQIMRLSLENNQMDCVSTPVRSVSDIEVDPIHGWVVLIGVT